MDKINIIDTSLKNQKDVASEFSSFSKIPDNLTSATKASWIAATRSLESKKKAVSDGMSNASTKLEKEQEQEGINSKLSNFRPGVLKGNAIQKRNSQVEGTDEDDVRIKASLAKSELLAGIDPTIAAIATQLKALLALGAIKTQLLLQTQKLEDQINALTAKLNSLLGTQAATNTLNEIQQNIEALEAMYVNTKKILDNLNKAYMTRWLAYQKARDARDRILVLTGQKIDDLLAKILTIPEIPRFIKFPKFPKLPSVNITKANIKLMISNVINNIKKSARDSSKKSLEQSKKETKPKIETANPQDAILKASSTAKKTLQKSRDKIAKIQAEKSKAIDKASSDAIKQIHALNRGIIEKQANIDSTIDKSAVKIDKKIKAIQEQQRQKKAAAASTLADLKAQTKTILDQAKTDIINASTTMDATIQQGSVTGATASGVRDIPSVLRNNSSVVNGNNITTTAKSTSQQLAMDKANLQKTTVMVVMGCKGSTTIKNGFVTDPDFKDLFVYKIDWTCGK